MEKLKLGQQFPIPEEMQEIVKNLLESCRTHEQAMSFHARQLKTEREILWETVSSIFPEIDFSKYKMSLGHNEIFVSGIVKPDYDERIIKAVEDIINGEG